jgi:hypothetical protein
MRRYLPAFQQSPLVFATTKGHRYPVAEFTNLQSTRLLFRSALRFI